MKFLILIFIFCLSGKAILSQEPRYAVLKDKEGFINVRDKPGVNAAIKDTLHSGKIIFFFDEEELPGGWYPISYVKNQKPRGGYVHSSRVVFIENYTQFKVVKRTDTGLLLSLDTMQILIRTGKFNQKEHKLKFGPGTANLLAIDNSTEIWGMDGNVPRNEYRHIEARVGQSVSIAEKMLWKDLFEPNLGLTIGYYDKTDNIIYLLASNSDGAGAYMVIWAIENRRFTKREIGTPF